MSATERFTEKVNIVLTPVRIATELTNTIVHDPRGVLRLEVRVDGEVLTYFHPCKDGREFTVPPGTTASEGVTWDHSFIWSLNWKILTGPETLILHRAWKMAQTIPVGDGETQT